MADSVPVILSKARPSQGTGDRLEGQLVEALSERPGVELLVVPHLYDLAADGPAVEQLRSLDGDLIVLAWLYPRSAFWVLDAHRIAGRLGTAGASGGDEPDTEAAPSATSDGSARTIWCLDLRAHDRAEPHVHEIDRLVEAALSAGGPGSRAPAAPPRVIEEATRPRWYPVVDYGRCANCLECLNFCIFGVYGLDEADRIVAEEPDACRPGCPACARICPAGAIMFPEHADPAIAGDPEASAAGLKLDLSQLFGGEPADLAAGERDRALKEQGQQESEPGEDDLDRLVDELDEMDL